MARDFDRDDWEDFNDHNWDETPAWLWDQVTNGEGWNDDYGQMLFDMLFVDPVSGDVRDGVYQALTDWFESEYDLDFGEVFDWDAWREWYE